MWNSSRCWRLVPIAAAAIAAVGAVHLTGWPAPDRTLEFSGLLVAALLCSQLGTQHGSARDWTVVPPSFVFGVGALLLFGVIPGVLVATAATLAGALARSNRLTAHVLVHIVAVGLSMQAAGLVYELPGAVPGQIIWPWQSVPISAAVVTYVGVLSALTDLVLPLSPSVAAARGWAARFVQNCPAYLIGAGVGSALAELVAYRAWNVLPVAAASGLLLYRAYAHHLDRLDEQRCGERLIDSVADGMAAVDTEGRITFWSGSLEKLLGCPPERALGRPLVHAVPALARTALPSGLRDALARGASQKVPQVRLSAAPDARVLQVHVVPVEGGARLVWQDVTDRAQAEHAMKHDGERLALAAEGANDGLWEWDLRTQEFYASGRWRAMVGLPARAGIGRPDEWLDRVHPDDLEDLKRALEAHLSGRSDVFTHEHRIRHEDGTYRRFLCRGLAAAGGGRRRDRVAGSLTDTTEHAIAQQQLQAVGFLDPLTGLFNRAVFVEGLGRRLGEFKTQRVSNAFAVLYLDLDRFKIVNDSLGHLVGDELLIAVSRRLESCLRPGDALARLGGDEFAVLLNGLVDDAQANAIAFRIQDALAVPFSIGGREVFTSASIGIAFGPGDYASPDDIMRDADTAMYHAKSRGKARHEVFDAAMHARVRDRLSLENDLRRAIGTCDDFEVQYQPIVSLTTGMCVGFESLVRWKRNGDAISPAIFIPVAEELGLIEPLGTWVLERACQTFAEWQRSYPAAGLDCITVNVSSRQLVQQNFLRLVQRAVRDSGLEPASLRLEITETALMDSPGEAAGVLRELRDFGVKVYLDDFGTGYSSLSHLHKLPVDALKIDSSFVRSLLLPRRPAIVESILALARTLNTSVVAEGIETDVQARELERLGCTHAQGFLFSRPLSTRAAEELVRARKPLGSKEGRRAVQEPAWAGADTRRAVSQLRPAVVHAPAAGGAPTPLAPA